MIDKVLINLWWCLQILIGYNLFMPLLLFLFYSIEKKPLLRSQPKDNAERDFAIIVTAYEQTDSLHAVVDSILKLNYRNYLVYIVADKCDVSNLRFDDERVVLLRPPETLASNTRSHFYAINHFKRDHDVLTIIDSDNLVDPEYCNEMNEYFNNGFVAVQGIRKPKNLDSNYACLDACRDIYYHFYDGLVLFNIGSSATLSGSGMAFTTSLYRECLEHLDITGAGFDKILQKEIVGRGFRIAYNEKAVVYDEKTTKSEQLVKQRARWINTWFRYFYYGFSLVTDGLKAVDFNKILFGVILLRPPLFIFLILSWFFLFVNVWISHIAVLLWLTGFACFVIGFFIALFNSKPDKRIIRSLVGIPRFVFFQVWSLFKVRKANKNSVATTHYSGGTINDIKL